MAGQATRHRGKPRLYDPSNLYLEATLHAPEGYRFTLCRAIAHTWRLNPGSPNAVFLGQRSEAIIPLVCDQCGTERIDALSRFSGALMQRRYIHPEGYDMDYGDAEPGDRVSRSDWRKALVDTVEAQAQEGQGGRGSRRGSSGSRRAAKGTTAPKGRRQAVSG